MSDHSSDPLPSSGNAADPAGVSAMFDALAPIYDLMNSVMTAGVDGRWRRAAIRAAQITPGMRVLDVACGTGRLTEAAARRAVPGGDAVGIDASHGMVRRARRGGRRGARSPLATSYRHADALALPFAADAFDVATIGFGLRNLRDYRAGLDEMVRVVRPGGRVVVLELARPPGGPGAWLFDTWFRRVVPVLGRIVRRSAAYAYLPASVLAYPTPASVADLMAACGLRDVRWRRLTTGLATLHVGTVPAGEHRP